MDTKKLSEISLILIGLTLVVIILERFQSFMRPLTIAFVLSFLFTPLYRLSKKARLKTILKISATVIILVAIFAVIGNSLIGGVADLSKAEVFQDLDTPALIDDLSFSFAGADYSITQFMNLEDIISSATALVELALQSIVKFVSEFFLIIIFLIFMLPAQNIWIKNTSKNMGQERREKFRRTIFDMEDGVRDYLKAKTLISLGTAVTSFIVLLLFRVEYAFLFSVLIFAFNFIPNIGSIIAVGLILVVVFFSTGFVFAFFALAILLILIQMIFGNYIEPIFTGKKLELSPLTVLISLLFWGSVWGVGGMLFSVPLTLAIKILLKHSKSTERLATFIS